MRIVEREMTSLSNQGSQDDGSRAPSFIGNKCQDTRTGITTTRNDFSLMPRLLQRFLGRMTETWDFANSGPGTICKKEVADAKDQP